jgi:hypothetical protein
MYFWQDTAMLTDRQTQRLAREAEMVSIELQRYNVCAELVSRTRVQITEEEWAGINYVDYLQFDSQGLLTADFDVHSRATRVRMQAMSKHATWCNPRMCE